MKTQRPVRVAVFRTKFQAERVVAEARRAGFHDVRLLTDKSYRTYLHDSGELPGELDDVTPSTLPRAARRLPLEGAVAGLILGFGVAWLLGALGVMDKAMGFLVLPVAGLIFCGLIGAMLTRGFTKEEDSFYDQEVPEGSFVVAVEDPEPTRLSLAERIFAAEGAKPLPLVQG